LPPSDSLLYTTPVPSGSTPPIFYGYSQLEALANNWMRWRSEKVGKLLSIPSWLAVMCLHWLQLLWGSSSSLLKLSDSRTIIFSWWKCQLPAAACLGCLIYLLFPPLVGLFIKVSSFGWILFFPGSWLTQSWTWM
jgi:hypothetical protein